MNDLTFQPAEERDLPSCVQALLHSDLGDHHFAENNLAERSVRSAFRHEQLYTARTPDGDCVGFIWLLPRGAFFVYPYLHVIAVREDMRGRGIGTKLLAYAEELVGATKLFLEVDEFNPRAHALYESVGYQTVGAIPDLFEPGFSGFLMMKDIEKASL